VLALLPYWQPASKVCCWGSVVTGYLVREGSCLLNLWHAGSSSGARTTYYSSSNSTAGYYECDDTATSPAYHQNGERYTLGCVAAAFDLQILLCNLAVC
jgi:hypothetical protein